MKTIQEILDSPVPLNAYTGSTATRDMVAEQIKAIYGEAELANYEPSRSAMTFASWLKLGYRPKKGSKALKSVTYVEYKDAKGNIKKLPRTVNLFYYRAVCPLNEQG